MPQLKVERVGGLAGFGMAGSRVSSRGGIEADELEAKDKQAVDALFHKYGLAAPGPTAVRDGFTYRLSRIVDGVEHKVEVPEAEVPAAVVRCVRDELI